MSPGNPGAAEVAAFWRDAGAEKWFTRDAGFDAESRDRFGPLHAEAAAGRLEDWAQSPEGALALLILFDQFSRNLFRDSAETYAKDEKARDIALHAVEAGFDRKVDPTLRKFFYMPFMHSETLADQALCVALCHGLGDADTFSYARHHQRIIHRFGRFPHRNRILGRHISAAEQVFLDGGGFSG